MLGRLADRIEDNLSVLLVQAEGILRDNERHVLALAHALETHKTLSGDDVTAVLECQRGPLVDGTPYGDDAFIERLREYHQSAALAHRNHSNPELPMPVPEPVFASGVALADGYGAQAGGSPNGDIPHVGPTAYDPPLYGPPDGSSGGSSDGQD
jgi:hypothetical protein